MIKSILGRVARGLRRITGLSSKQLAIPYAWIPYHLYQDGSAWRPHFVTLELTYLADKKKGALPVKFVPDLNAEEIHRHYASDHVPLTNKCFYPCPVLADRKWSSIPTLNRGLC